MTLSQSSLNISRKEFWKQEICLCSLLSKKQRKGKCSGNLESRNAGFACSQLFSCFRHLEKGKYKKQMTDDCINGCRYKVVFAWNLWSPKDTERLHHVLVLQAVHLPGTNYRLSKSISRINCIPLIFLQRYQVSCQEFL